jgi:pimeloyl-ACP methyl ester carboxylesterase
MLSKILDKGSGNAVVFANSAVSDYRLFEPQIAALSSEFRVVAQNARALTGRGRQPYTLWDLANDCRELMDQLKIKKAVIAGCSMGGYMGLRFALRYPERLAGLVLLGSTAVKNTPEEETAFLAKFREMEQQPTIPRDWALWCSTIVFSAQAQQTRPELVSQWVERWTTYPAPEIIEECRCWLNREDLTPRLSQIAAPTLIVHGEEDGAIPIDRTRPMAAQMANARMVSLPNVGHFLTLESPAEVTKVLREFLHTVYGKA